MTAKRLSKEVMTMANPLRRIGESMRGGILSASNLTTAVIYAAFGLALLIAPNTSGRIFGFALAVLLLLMGAYYLVSYLRSERLTAFMRQDFTLGLTLLAGGVLLLMVPEIPGGVLPYVWGGALIVGGFAKAQTALDMKRFSAAGWWHCLIGAAIALVLGVTALCNPFATEMVLLRFLGGGLLAEGLMDGYCWYIVRRLRKALR